MKNIILTAAIFLATTLTAFAGGEKNTSSSILKGTVVDNNNEVIAGALISIEGMDEKVYTDLDGNFEIQNATGKAVKVSFVSYADKSIEVSSTENEMKIVLEDK
tara:strand:+ start:1382 stop:1693 length:312 start_codon:yes stop_codon:yes gene_type:complete